MFGRTLGHWAPIDLRPYVPGNVGSYSIRSWLEILTIPELCPVKSLPQWWTHWMCQMVPSATGVFFGWWGPSSWELLFRYRKIRKKSRQFLYHTTLQQEKTEPRLTLNITDVHSIGLIHMQSTVRSWAGLQFLTWPYREQIQPLVLADRQPPHTPPKRKRKEKEGV